MASVKTTISSVRPLQTPDMKKPIADDKPICKTPFANASSVFAPVNVSEKTALLVDS
eukprot:CAMPEP_0169206040 /NCGR_PEP_ID=MMETSP1016-20121227/12831_1 /TAXON_ID=342587 /ORGANISM="Karlodinium micrum, Strain CCMP2283" /LENGTH=56 /DNA_ID=CAMNT_0009283211 /DNA_START=91 /DNA_END=261 /DNA_ORIENTATION=-